MAPKRRRDDRNDEDGLGGGSDSGGGGRGIGERDAGAGAVRTVALVQRLALTQHLMRHGYMLESKAKEAFQRLTGSDSGALYHQAVADQNREMEALNLRIKTMKYPLDDERYVGFVNTHADGPAKFGTRYSPHEREFFRAAMEAIALDEDAAGGVGSMPSIALLNMEVRPHAAATQQQPGDEDGGGRAAASQPQAVGSKMTKAAKEAALRKLVADGWLRHGSASGHYALGVRTFLELGPQLLDLPDLPDSTRAAWQDLM